jgi:EAL and modified HD-GYP domain-containing signal transduction protein
LQAARIPSSQATGLRLIRQIQREELDFHAVEDLIQHDISLSHSLLKYLNSAAFLWADPVESIRQGLNLLGSDEIRKWAWMASLSGLGQNRPQVLMSQVLMRGRFCEAIARAGEIPLGNSDPFLLGMFSLLDVILQRPLKGILADLNIGPSIRDALLGTAGETDRLVQILRIVKSYEVGDWRAVIGTARGIGLSADALGTCYLESLSWVESVSSSEEGAVRSTTPVVFHRSTDTSRVLRQ